MAARKGKTDMNKKHGILALAIGALVTGSAAAILVAGHGVETRAASAYSLAYDLDLSVSTAVTATSNTGTMYGYGNEYTQSILDSTNSVTKEWKAYGYNPNSWAVAGTRFGGKQNLLISAITNSPDASDTTNYGMYIGSTAVFTEAITKVEVTTLANFGTVTMGKLYLQVSANADFSSSSNYSLDYAANSTLTFDSTVSTDFTAGTANRYYRLVIEKNGTSKNAGGIISHVKFYKTVEEVTVTGVTISGSDAVAVGESITLTATVTPAGATDKTVTWSSSDENVAVVDENGKVTGLNNGTATIKATSNAKSSVYDELLVTVSGAPSGTARTIFNGTTMGLTGSYYSDKDFSGQNYVFHGNNVMYSTSYYQIQLKKDTAAYVYNRTAMSAGMTKIIINISNYSGAATDFVVYTGSAANPSTVRTASVSNLSYSYTPASGDKYWKISASGTATTYINSIVIEYGATETAATAAAYVLGISPDVDHTKGYCTGDGGNYELAKAVVTGLGTDALAEFETSTDATIASARARYEHWAAIYGDTTPYATTFGGALNNVKATKLLNNGNTAIYIAAASAFIALAGAGALVVLRKKKESK